MIIWFVITLIFIGIEVGTLALVSVWFAFAALILTMTSSYIENPTHEVYFFITLSAIFLLLTRPIVKKLLARRKPIEERIYGQEVKILKVLEEGIYEVKLDGKYWRAISHETLEVGDHSDVEKIEGNKLILVKSNKK